MTLKEPGARSENGGEGCSPDGNEVLSKHFFKLLDRLDAGIATFDATGTCRFCSALFEKAVGSAPGRIDDLLAALFGETDARHHFRATLESVRTGHEKAISEVRLTDSRGADRIYSVDALMLGEGAGAELAIVLRDKTGEISLRRDMEQIGRLAALGQITAGVAHEINNILTSVLGWSQIAAQNAEPDSVIASSLEIIEGNAKRAREISSHLLGVSRPVEKAHGPISVVEVVEDVLKMLSWEMRRGKIQVVKTFETGELCLGNFDRIAQVFINIVRNAMDAMPDGGVLKILIKQQGNHVVASFADSGPGMDPAILEQIFDPFFTTKRNGEARQSHGGTGLGLALCRDILEQHGGRIEVESAPGKGTRFAVLLPITQLRPSVAAENGAKRSSVPPGITILVVDDEPDIGEMIRTALELQGVNVLTVENGEAAVQLCRDKRFDAAFIDFSMPGLSGHDLGYKLLEIQPGLPIVFMSGREVEMDEDFPLAEFVKKPFGLEDIQIKLTEIVGAG